MAGFTGGCLCQAVTYKSNADPLMILNCHCKNCRRLTGSVFGTNLFVPEDQLQFDGELKTFNHKADSGNAMQRRFCIKCGTQLFGSSSGRPNIVSVRAGTVDNLSIIKPNMNVFTDSMVPSTQIDPNLPSAAKMPPKLPGAN